MATYCPDEPTPAWLTQLYWLVIAPTAFAFVTGLPSAVALEVLRAGCVVALLCWALRQELL